MPRLHATWMSTASRMAFTPSRTWVISFSSGPRTAATMQNSVAPVARVSTAAFTSEGMSSQAARTGEGNRPDWLQKWQSSGQPPVFRLMMPSTSTSGPQWAIRTSWASCSSSGNRSSGSCRQARACSCESPTPRSSTCSRASSSTSVSSSVTPPLSQQPPAGRRRGVTDH
jgi:hypothetical protein